MLMYIAVGCTFINQILLYTLINISTKSKKFIREESFSEAFEKFVQNKKQKHYDVSVMDDEITNLFTYSAPNEISIELSDKKSHGMIYWDIHTQFKKFLMDQFQNNCAINKYPDAKTLEKLINDEDNSKVLWYASKTSLPNVICYIFFVLQKEQTKNYFTFKYIHKTIKLDKMFQLFIDDFDQVLEQYQPWSIQTSDTLKIFMKFIQMNDDFDYYEKESQFINVQQYQKIMEEWFDSVNLKINLATDIIKQYFEEQHENKFLLFLYKSDYSERRALFQWQYQKRKNKVSLKYIGYYQMS